MQRFKPIQFDVITVEDEHDQRLTSAPQVHIGRMEVVQIKNNPGTLVLVTTFNEGTRSATRTMFDRHLLIQGLKHFLEELEPSTEYLILKELQKLNKNP